MTVIFSLYSSKIFAKSICKALTFEMGSLSLRQFPDKETYIEILSDVKNQDIIFIATLDKPNSKVLPLLFAAQTAKDLGANHIGLIAPYLSYMRQDQRFKTGEAITAKYFSQIISNYFDWMITIDPHLHRIKNLYEIYAIPTYCLHSTLAIANWIQENVKDPLIVGPDKESEQWVNDIAEKLQVPYIVLGKKRMGDKLVRITMPNLHQYKNLTPILIDDIISSGATMIESVNQLRREKMKPPIIIAIHAIFTSGSYEKLTNLDIQELVTTNTIKHRSNQIDIAGIIIDCVRKVQQHQESK